MRNSRNSRHPALRSRVSIALRLESLENRRLLSAGEMAKLSDALAGDHVGLLQAGSSLTSEVSAASLDQAPSSQGDGSIQSPILTAPAPTVSSTPTGEDQVVTITPSSEDQAVTITPSHQDQAVRITASGEDQAVTNSADRQTGIATAAIAQVASVSGSQQSGSLAGSSTAAGSAISSSSGTSRTVNSGQEEDGSSSLPAESQDTQSTLSPADEVTTAAAANSSDASNGGPVTTALMPPTGVQSGLSPGALAPASGLGSASRLLAGSKAPGAETGALLPESGEAEQVSSVAIRSEQPAGDSRGRGRYRARGCPGVPQHARVESLTTRSRWRPKR